MQVWRCWRHCKSRHHNWIYLWWRLGSTYITAFKYLYVCPADTWMDLTQGPMDWVPILGCIKSHTTYFHLAHTSMSSNTMWVLAKFWPKPCLNDRSCSLVLDNNCPQLSYIKCYFDEGNETDPSKCIDPVDAANLCTQVINENFSTLILAKIAAWFKLVGRFPD